MNRESVSALLDMICAAKQQTSAIQRVASALEDDGEVTELIAGSLDEAYTELEMAEEDLWEYRATKAEDGDE